MKGLVAFAIRIPCPLNVVIPAILTLSKFVCPSTSKSRGIDKPVELIVAKVWVPA